MRDKVDRMIHAAREDLVQLFRISIPQDFRGVSVHPKANIVLSVFGRIVSLEGSKTQLVRMARLTSTAKSFIPACWKI